MKISRIYSDGMILQRGRKNIIEGLSDAESKVKVCFDSKEYEAKSDDKGHFAVYLDEKEAGGPYSIEIADSKEQITINDVWFGDVFLLGGQSNMELPVCRTLDLYEDFVKDLDYPLIRMFQLPKDFRFDGPDDSVSEGEWIAARIGMFMEFSALGFYFAQRKFTQDGVPVGLVHASVGGTHIEAFMSDAQVRKTGAKLRAIAAKEGRELKCRCLQNDSCKMCYEEVMSKDKDPLYVSGVIKSDIDNMMNWGADLDNKDLGLKEEWFSHEWTQDEKKDSLMIDVPNSWINDELGQIKGSVWVQTTVDVPREWCDDDVRLYLGTIVDADFTYVNGTLVGNTEYFYPPRRYVIKKGILKPGKNVITVRVIVNNNVGEFKKDMPYYLRKGDDYISLEGKWVARIAVKKAAVGGMNFFTWHPTALFNKMIYPVRNISFDSLLFYQGESNSRYPEDYEYLMKDMIEEWRSLFGNLPFIFAELPYFRGETWDEENDDWDRMRISQKKVERDVENTAMVPMYDLGQYNEIHTQNKRDVADRFYEKYLLLKRNM